ncbi:P-loop NTPase [Holophaga foetida]|uniref:ATP-binding protein n=1 Tax=Holophaga foetida TaxID=35839 RepID=UPI000247467C|nr:P-loop NTPase [Holophaga foetida]
MKIAISGKGGVGKTTMAANLAKLFRNEGFNVYAVDADPDSSLGLALGISEDRLKEIRPVIEMKELMDQQTGGGAIYTLNPAVDHIIDEYSIQLDGIRFLRMGGVKQGGSACYCRENTFLRALVNSLILDNKDIVILDMGAGIEHLTRGTSGGVDLMIVVTEPGRASIQTARIVENLARELGIKDIRFIANKVRTDKEETFIREHFTGKELLGIQRYDEVISDKAMGFGQTPGEADSAELKDLLTRIVHRTHS